MKKKITLIVAASSNNAIGKDNDLLWRLSEDLKRFKKLTSGHAIIMGRKTFESLPKALPNRTNIVITRNQDYTATGAVVCSSIEEALEIAKEDEQPFIIGGGEIYKQAFPIADCLELTRVHKDYEGDTFFPEIDETLWELTQEDHYLTESLPYSFLTYQKKTK